MEFIKLFDTLFDICNSSTTTSAKEYNRAYKGLPHQVDFLKTAVRFLNEVKVVNSKGQNITERIKSLKCWQITINAIQALWEVLQCKGYLFLLTRRLNQDALENFFGSLIAI